MNFIRRDKLLNALQGVYEEAYEASLQCIILETKNQWGPALLSWDATLNLINFRLSKLPGKAKTTNEQSLMTSILDIERQCRERITYLKERQVREKSRQQQVAERDTNPFRSSQSFGADYSTTTTSAREPTSICRTEEDVPPQPPASAPANHGTYGDRSSMYSATSNYSMQNPYYDVEDVAPCDYYGGGIGEHGDQNQQGNNNHYQYHPTDHVVERELRDAVYQLHPFDSAPPSSQMPRPPSHSPPPPPAAEHLNMASVPPLPPRIPLRQGEYAHSDFTVPVPPPHRYASSQKSSSTVTSHPYVTYTPTADAGSASSVPSPGPSASAPATASPASGFPTAVEASLPSANRLARPPVPVPMMHSYSDSASAAVSSAEQSTDMLLPVKSGPESTYQTKRQSLDAKISGPQLAASSLGLLPTSQSPSPSPSTSSSMLSNIFQKPQKTKNKNSKSKSTSELVSSKIPLPPPGLIQPQQRAASPPPKAMPRTLRESKPGKLADGTKTAASQAASKAWIVEKPVNNTEYNNKVKTGAAATAIRQNQQQQQHLLPLIDLNSKTPSPNNSTTTIMNKQQPGTAAQKPRVAKTTVSTVTSTNKKTRPALAGGASSGIGLAATPTIAPSASVAKKPRSRPKPKSAPPAPRGKVAAGSGNAATTKTCGIPALQPIPVALGKNESSIADKAIGSDAGVEDEDDENLTEIQKWEKETRKIVKGIRGIDETAANQIMNDVILKGDEVHWEDIAGLEQAKMSLKETVVYPFLRPDLFSGLREPARGMLLFGPPGTGKTMLARAVATESKSTFFSISASSLVSKYLGESEKLVRALFLMSKALAPSIIFVDEIDSLLSTRSDSGEHETSRRIKNEFLVQWSDLQHAAAGKEREDSQRVLVLAATNIPWAIDEAARRRFVRRQYIPLPERETRKAHLQKLLSHQIHTITEEEFAKLVDLTEGFSGSDLTALAKDAAMGPLRSLGEALLTTPRDQIRGLSFEDFESSLKTIRPSVSKEGLERYANWASMYGSLGA